MSASPSHSNKILMALGQIEEAMGLIDGRGCLPPCSPDRLYDAYKALIRARNLLKETEIDGPDRD
jgi:hypothetical protein